MFCEIAGAILILAACGKEAQKPIFMRGFRTMYQKEPQKTRVGRMERGNRLLALGSRLSADGCWLLAVVVGHSLSVGFRHCHGIFS